MEMGQVRLCPQLLVVCQAAEDTRRKGHLTGKGAEESQLHATGGGGEEGTGGDGSEGMQKVSKGVPEGEPGTIG